MTQKLEHASIALSGINLIEASAGTGKTYAITSLYLRLLVEKELLPDQILVVTYTEAATEELRARIRSRIREAIDFSENPQGEDPFLDALIGNCSQIERTKKRELLEGALGAFDMASIFTIHAFSLRALQDNAFESGSLYDTELVTDQTELVGEILDDFWRRHFFIDSAPLLGFALQNRAAELFSTLLNALRSGSGARIIPEFSEAEVAALDVECGERYRMLSTIWMNDHDEIKELLKCDKGLRRSEETYREDLLGPLLEKLEAFVFGGNPYDLFSGFVRFTTAGIAKGTKTKALPPQHLFFESCEALQIAVNQRFLALQAELATFYRKSLIERKRAANIRFFDDLLDDLYHALLSESGGGKLAGTLREKYRAALIDEFQDTDPVQYEIFRKIYAGSDNPLFLVGDPKQAIYSFRGADIFAYMRAAREVSDDRQFTLTENWRSSSRLLDAFNMLFENDRHPFLYDEIAYYPLTSGNPEQQQGCGEVEPLRLWLMDSRIEKNETLTVDAASRIASASVAGEIARILRDGDSVDGVRSVEAGDIAIIVRTHRQGAMVLDALRQRGIAGVMRSDKSIFSSMEADEVRVLLSALCDPGSESKVRAALVTGILGRTGNDIACFADDEAAWSEMLSQFRHYHHLWQDRGFMVMSRELMAKEGVRGRLLNAPDSSGERWLTNLLHCFDLLHQEEHQRGSGMEKLAAWFSERCAASESREEFQIRLETDEAAVKVLTVHISKGLEFPVVFCPFLWSGINSTNRVVMFHNDNGDLVKDFGSPDIDRHRSIAGKEALGECLRLLYVALTRAKYRCYLFSAKIRSESSPLSYLLYSSDDLRNVEDPLAQLQAGAAANTARTMAERLQLLAERSGGSIGFNWINPEPQDCSKSASFGSSSHGKFSPLKRSFNGMIESGWRVSSFTSFCRHEFSASELPDRDEQPLTAPQAVVINPEKNLFAFPRGAQAGIFMHGIFEKLNFASPSILQIRELVTKGLDRYGYDHEWEPSVTKMVQQVLGVPLSSPNGTFTLGALRRGSWVTEMEFFFPLSFITPAILGEVLSRYGALDEGIDLAALASKLQFRPVRGMMMGFMDMVFVADGRYYLLDWKSNFLGSSYEDYNKEAMKEAMETNLYALQYLLYTVALDRYLSLRVKNYSYGEHFGGVIYVFLRGVHGEYGETKGFFRDRPQEELIKELTNILIQQGG
ncbi:MAG: exodeoxyribonuclease V subunit beta [Chlorobiaceae bacterium]|nr:exodeoxyribonuclease V subunit beta [Chlorobiaceae bacterium]